MFCIAPLIGTQIDHAEIVDKACRRAGLTQDQVARIYGVSPQCFSQQTRGVGHFSVNRLLAMTSDADGRKFVGEYWPLLGAALGIPHIEAALMLWKVFNESGWGDVLRQLVDRFQVRLLKAELRDDDDDRKRA